MDENKNQGPKWDAPFVAAVLTLAAIVIINIVSLFFLPSTILTIFSDRRLSTVVFAACGCIMVGLAGIMAVFSPRQNAWLIAELLLALVDVVLISYNFTMV